MSKIKDRDAEYVHRKVKADEAREALANKEAQPNESAPSEKKATSKKAAKASQMVKEAG